MKPLPLHPTRLRLYGAAAAALLCGLPAAHAQEEAIRPQIVFAIGNSQSMDGSLSGAIMTGSGSSNIYEANQIKSLQSFTSPTHYEVPAGFSPPVQAAGANGKALYTVTQNRTWVDNSPSRLNVAKAGIQSVLQKYLETIDFALVTYKLWPPAVVPTYVYYMSPPGGFKYTNTQEAGMRYAFNPCFDYKNRTDGWVYWACNNINIRPHGKHSTDYRYMEIWKSSDDPDVNDVLYSKINHAMFILHGSATIGRTKVNDGRNTPYTLPNALEMYKAGIQVHYGSKSPNRREIPQASFPTNAGFIPYSSEVMYLRRGEAYSATQSHNDGSVLVSMTSLPSSPSARQIEDARKKFEPYLKPETGDARSSEIKAAGGQASTAGLIIGAGKAFPKGYVFNSDVQGCGGQYVVLITDGLPTQDLNRTNWPPPGNEAGVGYGVWTQFSGLPANDAYGIRSGIGASAPRGALVGTNSQAVQDAVDEIAKLRQKGIKTYVIGLGAGADPSLNPAANAVLNAMAIAGGTGQQYPATDIVSFQAALDAVTSQVNATTQIKAPVAAGSITSGSKVYVATSNNQSGSLGGHIEAYNTSTQPGAQLGQGVGSAIWDAGSPERMSTAKRRDSIWSTQVTPGGAASGAGALTKLADMDEAAFGWPLATPQDCVPSVETIKAYTFNPSYGTGGDSGSSSMGFPEPVPNCSYLAGRMLNWMLGVMSPNNNVQYVGVPGSATLLSKPGYIAFARNNQKRKDLILATSTDGILYGIDAHTGDMQWGWMPRHFVRHLADYTGFASRQIFDGGFRVADASTLAADRTTHWSSYVVGTAEGGAYHYALKLSSNTSATDTRAPMPESQAWGIHVAGGKSPQMQAPLVVSVGSRQFALFIVNTTAGSTTTSTLYEVDVATGQAATAGGALQATLPFVASSAMSYDMLTGTLWVGDDKGAVWAISITGQSTLDAGTAIRRAVLNPAEPVKYVGYGESRGLPYIWVSTQDKVTVFALAGAEMGRAIWASRGGATPQGFINGAASTDVRPLKAKGTISAEPVLANGVLIVPVYVKGAANTCGPGKGFYQLFDMVRGSDPRVRVTYNNEPVENGLIEVGNGAPLTPTLHGSDKGIIGLPGTNVPSEKEDGGGNGGGGTSGTITIDGRPLSRAVLWRQR